MSFFNSFLKGLQANDTLHDYNHASKIFASNAFELSPKFTFLYHVFFDLAPGITYQRQNELGMLVKSVDLPRFDIATKTLNSYNRPNIVQNKISYQPVQFIFHDDSANVVRNFWFQYYNFYYRDSDLAEPSYYDYDYKYSERNTIDTQFMGYNPKNDRKRFLKSIRIYSLSKKISSEYILINPIITQFTHGRHESSSINTTLEHSMQIEYETVLYKEGASISARGFAQSEYYDQRSSPLARPGATKSILGPGGLLQSVDSVANNLAQGNFLSAAVGLARSRQTFKGTNIGSLAATEAKGLTKDVLRGQNPFARINVPTLNDVSNTTGSPPAQSRSSLNNRTLSTSPTIDRPVLPAGINSSGSATSNSSKVGV